MYTTRLLSRLPAFAALPLALLGVVLVAVVDYATGNELRVYPLYFIPVSLVAGKAGRPMTLAIAGFSAVCWQASNYLADIDPRLSALEVWNFAAQLSAFLLVGFLLSNLSRSLERERLLSRTDALTGLENTRAFYEQVPRTLAACRRHKRPITLAYIDVDNFKKVNDTLGHQGGDVVLRQVAQTLASAIRGQDLAARMGGDEFAVLLPETDYEGAKAFLERARAALAEKLAGGALDVTLSIGAVVFLKAPSDADALVHQADALMYAAKAAGKNRFHIETVSELPA